MPRALHGTILSLLAAVLAVACDAGGVADPAKGDPYDRPPLVKVAKGELRMVRREIESTAYLESEHQVTVLSKIAGRIAETVVSEGQAVSKGQVIARLDARQARAARRQVEVQLEDRKVRLQLAKLEVEASQRRTEQARLERDRATAEWQRQSRMDPDVVVQKVVEEAKFTLDTAKQALRVAQFNERKSELDALAAANDIKELDARLEESDLTLSEHDIKAPIDGVVVEKHVKGGETISPSSPLFLVTDLEHLVCYISLPQAQLPLVRQAHEVIFTSDAYRDRNFTGDVDMVGAVIDRASGSFRLRMRVRDDEAPLLRPGMFVRARILTEKKRQALMLPKAAVLAEGDRFVVFALRGKRVTKLTVEAGLEEETRVECRNRGDDGVHPQDLLVVSGHEDLKDGDLVEVGKE